MLNSKSISYSYDGINELCFPDLKLKQSQSLLILGESGIGKTTLIYILAGLLRPNSGTLEINSIKINELNSNEIDRFRGDNIGMVFQSPRFVNNISILDNLCLSQYLSKNKKDVIRATQLLAQVGLEHKKHNKAKELSQGEQQRAAIALSVVKKPKLILADEPTSSLDDVNCAKTVSLLKEQAALNNASLIIITHDHRLKSQFNNHIYL